MPMRRKDWMPSSQALPKDQLGNEDQTRYRVIGRCSDGHKRWTGWFDDREDFDAFLWALARNSLVYERELWQLPTPHWHPDLTEGLVYEFAATTFLTSGAGSAQNWYKPPDWNNLNNKIEAIGGGASGSAVDGTTPTKASGGGGGAYNFSTNVNLAAASIFSYTIGSGGSGTTQGSSGSNDGNDGGDTFFNGTSVSNGSVGAQHGTKGSHGTSGAVSGGPGGAAASGVGSGFNGGNGGDIGSSANNCGSGGGGAGGPNAAGGNGGGASSGVTNGGQGDGTSGGSAGTGGSSANGTNGGNGTEWDSLHGSGGGGGGCQPGVGFSAGNGGNYGGGGGGARGNGSTTSGSGIQGMIAITYQPIRPESLYRILGHF